MLRLLLIAPVIVLAVAGCGDSDPAPEPTTVSVETPVATTTTQASTTSVPADDSAGDPAEADTPGADRPRSVADVVSGVLTGSETAATICDSLVTPAYVSAAYGDRQGCLAAQEAGSLAKSVEVGDVQESGATATAVAVPTGGPYDGVDVEVKLLAATDLERAWVIDSLRADVPVGP